MLFLAVYLLAWWLAISIHIYMYLCCWRKTTKPVIRLSLKQNFDTIDETLSGDKAVVEASRCFSCGICNDCDNCRLFCPELAVELETTRGINLDYCKGCGICVVECPRNAMALEEEKL